MELKVDTRAFAKAVAEKIPLCKKAASDVLNEEALKAIIGAKGVQGAVHIAPKATRGRIKADLNKKVQAVNNRRFFKAAANARGAETARTRSAYHSVKLLYVLAAKSLKRRGVGKGLSPAAWRQAVASRASEIAQKRDASRAYIVAGFLYCAQQLAKAAVLKAGLSRLKDRDVILPSEQRKSGGEIGTLGQVATKSSMVVEFTNNARGSLEIGLTAMNEGLRNAAKDMQTYIERKLAEAWNGGGE